MLRLTDGGVYGDDESKQCIPDHGPCSCNCDTDWAVALGAAAVLSLCVGGPPDRRRVLNNIAKALIYPHRDNFGHFFVILFQ